MQTDRMEAQTFRGLSILKKHRPPTSMSAKEQREPTQSDLPTSMVLLPQRHVRWFPFCLGGRKMKSYNMEARLSESPEDISMDSAPV